jgi:hypothetical protein
MTKELYPFTERLADKLKELEPEKLEQLKLLIPLDYSHLLKGGKGKCQQ